eukprot:GSChrysophyteH1.ASY1.ANO1.486.1 assembled CDS
MKKTVVYVALLMLSLLNTFVVADFCSTVKSCVNCTQYGEGKSQCVWDAKENVCMSMKAMNLWKEYIRFDDTCPVERHASESSVDFLSNWMGKLSGAGIYDKLTLLDLSLPGTHDTLTYDLSTRVSDGGADDEVVLAELLHSHDRAVPDVLGDFVRQQAQTQGLNYSDVADPQWYSLHFLQSNELFLVYLREIREWMEQHPTEVVVMWVSKHGSECRTGEDQYPNVPVTVKRAFWQKVEQLFEGLLLHGNGTDTSLPPVRLNETSIEEMVRRNARAVFYVSDYAELTGSSTFVLDGCLVDNRLGPSVDDEQSAVAWEQNIYKGATMTKFHDKQQQKLFLVSLATGVPTEQVVAAGDIRLLHHGDADADSSRPEQVLIEKCTAAFNIPNFSQWCPPTLLDVAQLENYYKQLTLEMAYQNRDEGWSFPNAIYINGVVMDGAIRTGTRLPWADGSEGGQESQHATTAYAYADTIIAFNLFLACNHDVVHDPSMPSAKKCADLLEILEDRRAKNPVSTWDDHKYGRHTAWPMS